MSIGTALYALLSTHAALSPLHGGRVYAVRFRQGSRFPALTYNTEAVRPLECRQPGPDRLGPVELTLLTTTYEEMERLSETITDALNNKTISSAGFRLSFSGVRPDFTEEDDELNALFKRLTFDLHATPELN